MSDIESVSCSEPLYCFTRTRCLGKLTSQQYLQAKYVIYVLLYLQSNQRQTVTGLEVWQKEFFFRQTEFVIAWSGEGGGSQINMTGMIIEIVEKHP